MDFVKRTVGNKENELLSYEYSREHFERQVNPADCDSELCWIFSLEAVALARSQDDDWCSGAYPAYQRHEIDRCRHCFEVEGYNECQCDNWFPQEQDK
jgi:hypothetical protein